MPRIYNRVYRKLNSLIDKHIPFNQFYRPTGFYQTLQNYVTTSGAEQIVVYPPEKSTLDVPKALLKASENQIFTPPTGELPAASITAIKQGRLYTDGTNFAAVISEDNKLIGDISLQVGTTNPEENGIFNHKYFTSPLGLKGNVFHTLIGGSGENNYFHWMIDSLPRLHLLQKAGWFDKIDWFVVPKHSLPYQKDTLRILGIPDTKIVEGHSVNHIKADTLFASTFVRNIEHIPNWACQFLRDKFIPAAQRIIQTPKRIYISRQDSSYRSVTNEANVLKVLHKYGFKKVELSELTFTEQVSLFKNAEVVVAPHGAGLTNLVFCRPGTQVIELFAREYTPPLYADLASKVNLKYNYLTSASAPAVVSLRAAMQKGVDVPVDKLESMVLEAIADAVQTMEQFNPEAV
ncbi:glycosyltransferase family 61 protein [Pontibacter cellulosilyticus]|uniref:Glycosyltransferase family 61 protein n=1 Tax=Pontibacter cellulosilyticus TaxID=1720253 RepID=A0A923N5J0_9BACT|nr:glycosyltransferase family 61 protein [Pontibacter cellulosilyticus]MBC5992539.1 glycosyltransferase family 61 protein [Pontibacter cellulosilyticus]